MFRKLKKKLKKSSSKKTRKGLIDKPANTIPTAHSDDTSIKDSSYPSRLLRTRSDATINYPHKERVKSKGKAKEATPSIPKVTSGMQRRAAALKVTRRHSEYNLGKIEDIGEFQSKLERFAINVQKFIDQGYEPIIARDYPVRLLDTDLIIPLEEYKNKNDLTLGRKQSVCLFEKNGELYTTRYVDMIHLYDKEPIMLPAKDGPYIFAIVAKRLHDHASAHSELLLELRVIALTTSGHGTLVKNNEERAAVICAGEFYVNDQKVILIDDKTGNFHENMAALKKDLEKHGKHFDYSEVISHMMGSAKKELFYIYSDELDTSNVDAVTSADERLLKQLVALKYQEPIQIKTSIPSISTSRLSTFSTEKSAEIEEKKSPAAKQTNKS